ncbi:hypothetical protein Y1Q_0001342 [Alligator mississippiensis]|uniref:Uncharacterized protein n=1 Tax=Alligator mississippiensis TaxID=8496 RepID=A0A151M929_ALLMI|nr:hypothetical protein Y1Q_0001342 [Alligator mississippiensis]
MKIWKTGIFTLAKILNLFRGHQISKGKLGLDVPRFPEYGLVPLNNAVMCEISREKRKGNYKEEGTFEQNRDTAQFTFSSSHGPPVR